MKANNPVDHKHERKHAHHDDHKHDHNFLSKLSDIRYVLNRLLHWYPTS